MLQVRQLARAGVTIVSGAGNSGPGWGTLLNPADDPRVIGVGGLRPSGRLATYSSRGSSLWELPHGVGRMGVDVVALGEFWAAHPSGGCQHQWGTSVACPVVVGVLALLLSSLGPMQRAALRSPAALKQVLAASSQRLPGRVSYLEQGSGALRPHALHAAMASFVPHLTSLPATLNLLDCPYMAPHCDETLYAGAPPTAFNLTLLDSYSPHATIVSPPEWRPASAAHAELLEVRVAYTPRFDSWCNSLGVAFTVTPAAATWTGVISGDLVVEVSDVPDADAQDDHVGGVGDGGGGPAVEQAAVVRPSGEPAPPAGAGGRPRSPPATRQVLIPVRLAISPTPPRARRLLVDLFHSSSYPAGFYPTDDLATHMVRLVRV